jgi:chemotaxis protein MotB
VRFRSLAKNTDDADTPPDALLGVEWTAEDREDNWLISYADLLSVIFAMVVLLFGRMMIASVPVEVEADAALVPAPAVAAARAPLDTAPAPASAPSREDRLAALVEQRFSGAIEARRRERGLSLAIPAVALFDSARARIQDSALPLLGELAATLREAGEARISVEGHTDSVPVQGGEFESNWDLAAARANAVTRYLLEQGFTPARLQSVSYADTRPVSDNGTAEGRAANRRVELQVEFAADAP